MASVESLTSETSLRKMATCGFLPVKLKGAVRI